MSGQISAASNNSSNMPPARVVEVEQVVEPEPRVLEPEPQVLEPQVRNVHEIENVLGQNEMYFALAGNRPVDSLVRITSSRETVADKMSALSYTLNVLSLLLSISVIIINVSFMMTLATSVPESPRMVNNHVHKSSNPEIVYIEEQFSPPYLSLVSDDQEKEEKKEKERMNFLLSHNNNLSYTNYSEKFEQEAISPSLQLLVNANEQKEEEKDGKEENEQESYYKYDKVNEEEKKEMNDGEKEGGRRNEDLEEESDEEKESDEGREREEEAEAGDTLIKREENNNYEEKGKEEEKEENYNLDEEMNKLTFKKPFSSWAADRLEPNHASSSTIESLGQVLILGPLLILSSIFGITSTFKHSGTFSIVFYWIFLTGTLLLVVFITSNFIDYDDMLFMSRDNDVTADSGTTRSSQGHKATATEALCKLLAIIGSIQLVAAIFATLAKYQKKRVGAFDLDQHFEQQATRRRNSTNQNVLEHVEVTSPVRPIRITNNQMSEHMNE